jgi:RNA polymerase subunit RPABC4/transcription elongation factor Spt4
MSWSKRIKKKSRSNNKRFDECPKVNHTMSWDKFIIIIDEESNLQTQKIYKIRRIFR